MSKSLSEFRKSYLIALGRITVNMNSLEEWTRTWIGLLLDSDFEFVLRRYPTERYGKILEVFELVFYPKVSDEDYRKDFLVLLEQLKTVYQKRNTFIHSQWHFAEDDSFVFRMKHLKNLKVQHDMKPSLDELNQLADEMASSISEVGSFINEIAPFNPNARNRLTSRSS